MQQFQLLTGNSTILDSLLIERNILFNCEKLHTYSSTIFFSSLLECFRDVVFSSFFLGHRYTLFFIVYSARLYVNLVGFYFDGSQ